MIRRFDLIQGKMNLEFPLINVDQQNYKLKGSIKLSSLTILTRNKVKHAFLGSSFYLLIGIGLGYETIPMDSTFIRFEIYFLLGDTCDTYNHPTYGRGSCISTSLCPNSLYISGMCESKPADVKCCFSSTSTSTGASKNFSNY